jgi:transposase
VYWRVRGECDPQGIYAELRSSHNAYQRLVKERTRITNLVKGLLDVLFPEFTHAFKDPGGVTALTVLSTCPIPGVIAGMAEDEFVAATEARHKGRRPMRKKLRALHYSAKTSIGIHAGAHSVSSEIAFLVDKLELIRQQINKGDSTQSQFSCLGQAKARKAGPCQPSQRKRDCGGSTQQAAAPGLCAR